MTQEKLKTISLSKLKVAEAEVEGRTERRVTFVASTAREDRDEEIVQIETFRLPTKGGGAIRVSDLPTGGADNIDVPLLTNHDMWNVEKTIGSVRRASFEDGRLIIEAGISSRDYAQDVFKLIEEGHLDNAFSIRYGDYFHNVEKSIDTDGEIVEISLVTRGSNRDAQVLEVKAMKGTQMENEEKPVASTVESETTPTEAPVEEVNKEAAEAPKAKETSTEETQPEPETAPENDKEKIMDPTTNHKELAAKQVKAPSQASTPGSTTAKGFLDTKAAVLEYARVAKSCNGDPTLTADAWKQHLVAKGITVAGGGSFLPTEVEQTMFKAWRDAIGALATFRRTRAKMSRFYAMTINGDTGRAGGHTPGDEKDDQEIIAIPRVTGLRTIFKKLPIDWIDIINDDSGELYLFRTRELTDRVLGEIVRASIIGDGRGEPASGKADRRTFVDGLGLYPIAADINASTDTSTTNGQYAAAVATKIANDPSDDDYAKIVKTLNRVKVEPGERKVLVIADNVLEAFQLATNAAGQRLYPVDVDFKTLFKVAEIVEFTPEEMAATGLDVIAYKDQGYTLGGIDLTTRNWFDGNKNKDVMLVETAVQGSLEGYHVAAGYASAATPAARSSKE